jgi:hypothetical protein
MSGEMLKVKEVVIKTSITSVFLSMLIILGVFRHRGFSIDQLITLGMVSLLVISGPIPYAILAALFPQPFTIGFLAVSLYVAAVIISKLVSWFKPENTEKKLNLYIPIAWCVLGFINTFMFLGAGA